MTGQVKEKMLTLRITEALNNDIDEVHEILEGQRDPHLSKVTKSETLIMLLKLGLEDFMRKNKIG
ncbi:MAG: hypothetical protein ACOVP4_04795 [Bacteriovoracaceae bacterium]